jgi:hypothetical protein
VRIRRPPQPPPFPRRDAPRRQQPPGPALGTRTDHPRRVSVPSYSRRPIPPRRGSAGCPHPFLAPRCSPRRSVPSARSAWRLLPSLPGLQPQAPLRALGDGGSAGPGGAVRPPHNRIRDKSPAPSRRRAVRRARSRTVGGLFPVPGLGRSPQPCPAVLTPSRPPLPSPALIGGGTAVAPSPLRPRFSAPFSGKEPLSPRMGRGVGVRAARRRPAPFPPYLPLSGPRPVGDPLGGWGEGSSGADGLPPAGTSPSQIGGGRGGTRSGMWQGWA